MSDKAGVLINWFFSIVSLPVVIVLLTRSYGLDFVRSDFIKLILELVFVGFVPLIIISLKRERWEKYGFISANWRKSSAYGLVCPLPF